MPSRGPQNRREGPGNAKLKDSKQLFQLLRFSHIFASTVREILEAKYLDEVSPHALSLSQFHLLKLISLNGAHHVSDAAEFLGVSPPAATKNIDKLERLGLLDRTPSKGDRRATLLSASRKGRRLVSSYERLKSDRLAPVLDHFSQAELRQLTRLLERLSLHVIQQEDTGEGLCLRCAAYVDECCPVGRLRNGCPYQAARAAHQHNGKRDAQ